MVWRDAGQPTTPMRSGRAYRDARRPPGRRSRASPSPMTGRLSPRRCLARRVGGRPCGRRAWRCVARSAAGRHRCSIIRYSKSEAVDGGGMIITGSHNPPDYNGCKMMLGRASPTSASRIRRHWAEIAAAGAFASVRQGKADCQPRISSTSYVARLAAGLPTVASRWLDRGLGCRQRRNRRHTWQKLAAIGCRAAMCCLNEKIDGTLPVPSSGSDDPGESRLS